MPTPRTSNRSPSGEKTATEILDAAERLFADRGYKGTSLRDVAAAVGIQNPSIYNHFASKAALYEAVIGRAVDPLLGELWDEDVDVTLSFLAKHRHLCRLLLKEMLSGEEPNESVVRALRATVERAASWAREAPETRDLDPTEVTLAVLAICHVVLGFHASDGLYQSLTGRKLSGKKTKEAQLALVERVSRALFSDSNGDC